MLVRDATPHWHPHRRAAALTPSRRALPTGYYVFKWPISYINNLLPTSSGSLNNNGMYGFYDGADGFTTVGNGNQNNLMYYNNLTNRAFIPRPRDSHRRLLTFPGVPVFSSVPTRGPAAYTIAGGPWFPNNNNNGGLTWPSCETDMCNAHSGGGFDYVRCRSRAPCLLHGTDLPSPIAALPRRPVRQ